MRTQSRVRHLTALAFGLLVAVGSVMGAGLAVEAGVSATADEGLRGIFPSDVPDGLSYDAFEELPPSWEAWSNETIESLETLYSGDLDAAGQRSQIAELEARLATIREAMGSPTYGLIHGQLAAIEGRLERRLELATAVLDVLDADPGLRDPLARFVSAVERYEDENLQSAAETARDVLRELDENSAEAAKPLWDVALRHYVNYNVRATVGEALVSELVREARVEDRPVRDFFLCTNIYGNSTTATNVDFDLKPSKTEARFDIVVRGEVDSRTTGYNKDATLFTKGHHYFTARKPIGFDGYRYVWQPATISVDANNNTYAARTKYSKVPILGKIANKIAVKEARKKRPQSEARARFKVGESVLPEFNSETEQRLGERNAELADDIRPRFEEVGLQPETIALSTTETALVASARVFQPAELAGSAPLDLPPPPNGAIVQIHESAINNAIDRLELAGRELTETELRKKIAELASKLAGKAVEIDPPEQEDGSKFAFAKEDPIRVKFENGSLVVTLRTGLKREGEADIKEQDITVPLQYSVDGDTIKVTRGTVKVSIKGGVATAAVLRRRIQQSIPEERTREATLEVEAESGATKTLAIDAVEMLDGWLMIFLVKA